MDEPDVLFIWNTVVAQILVTPCKSKILSSYDQFLENANTLEIYASVFRQILNILNILPAASVLGSLTKFYFGIFEKIRESVHVKFKNDFGFAQTYKNTVNGFSCAK